MKVCEAGQTLAYRCVVVCDVHVSGALTMNADSHFCCILFSYTAHVLFLGVKFATYHAWSFFKTLYDNISYLI